MRIHPMIGFYVRAHLREGYTPKGVYPCGEHTYHGKEFRHFDACRDGFVKTGEKRPPREGEWYLSGAIPAAYCARADLDTVFIIMQPFKTAQQPEALHK